MVHGMPPRGFGDGMDEPPPGSPPEPVLHEAGRAHPVAPLAAPLIALAALAIYLNCLTVPMILDDGLAIRDNTTIRSLWPPWRPLLPPCDGSAVDRRPITNLSLACNYAVSGLSVPGYHVVNVCAHALAGMLLFGIIRRTAELPALREMLGDAAVPLALCTALLWTVHPLHTSAVTYIVQRTEVLAGLFSFATLWCFIRGATADRPGLWFVAAFATCCLAMGSKESAAATPILVALYDRLLLSGSWRAVWRSRGPVHAALAASWIMLLALVVRHALLIPPSDPPVPGDEHLAVSWMASQPRALCLYLRLAAWPAPLILDYGPPTRGSLVLAIAAAAVVIGLAGATLVAVWRGMPVGLLGVWVFGPLAPSSSLVPIVPEWAAEKRFYMPLAAVILAVVLACHAGLRRRGRDGCGPLRRRLAVMAVAVAVVLLGSASVRRNHDYRSALAIWEDTVAKNPGNPRAWTNLGAELAFAGHRGEAVACYERALDLQPTSPFRLSALAQVQLEMGRTDDALLTCARYVAAWPDSAAAHTYLGCALIAADRSPEAVAALRTAVRLDPGTILAHFNLGRALTRTGMPEDAERAFRQVLALDPGHADASNALGLLLARSDRLSEAIPCFERAVQSAPRNAEARSNLGLALASSGRTAEAVAHYRAALAVKPGLVTATLNLAEAYASLGRLQDAAATAEEGLNHAIAQGQERAAGQLRPLLEQYRRRLAAAAAE